METKKPGRYPVLTHKATCIFMTKKRQYLYNFVNFFKQSIIVIISKGLFDEAQHCVISQKQLFNLQIFSKVDNNRANGD